MKNRSTKTKPLIDYTPRGRHGGVQVSATLPSFLFKGLDDMAVAYEVPRSAMIAAVIEKAYDEFMLEDEAAQGVEA